MWDSLTPYYCRWLDSKEESAFQPHVMEYHLPLKFKMPPLCKRNVTCNRYIKYFFNNWRYLMALRTYDHLETYKTLMHLYIVRVEIMCMAWFTMWNVFSQYMIQQIEVGLSYFICIVEDVHEHFLYSFLTHQFF